MPYDLNYVNTSHSVSVWQAVNFYLPITIEYTCTHLTYKMAATDRTTTIR